MKQSNSSLRLLALILIGALISGCSAKQNPTGIPIIITSTGPAATLLAGESTDLPPGALVSTSVGQDPLISMNLAASRSSLSSASTLVWLPGDRLAVASPIEVALIELPSPEAGPQTAVSIQSTHESDLPVFLSASREGEDLAWISSETSIQFWNPSQMENPKMLGSSSTPVTGIALQPGGDRLAAASLHGEITQLSTRAEDSPVTWQAPAWLSNLSYSPDGARLGGVDLATFTVYIFSLDGIVQQNLEWTSSANPNLYGAYFSPDWSRIAWAARGAVQIMEVPSGEEGPLLSHEDFISAVHWSPDSQVLATAAAQNTASGSTPIVILWNPVNGQILKTFVQQFAAQSLSFSPDSRKLAVMDVNGDLQVFSIEP